MSFLPGRLAATEGAYFLQESKHAVGRLSQKIPQSSPPNPNPNPNLNLANQNGSDILPEILRHSIPLKGIPPQSDPSISNSSKWLLPTSSSNSSIPISQDALNPLRAYVSLPQATFGPKRWNFPNGQPNVYASTANDLRQDRYSAIHSKNLKALAVGYAQIGKAFAIATTIIFGGAVSVFVYMAHKLQMESTEDIKTKGKDLIQPGVDKLRHQMVPVRVWAENMSRKWHIEGSGEGKQKSFVKEISKTLGPRTSN